MQFSLFYNLIEEIRTEMFTRNVYRVYLSIVEYLQVQRFVIQGSNTAKPYYFFYDSEALVPNNIFWINETFTH